MKIKCSILTGLILPLSICIIYSAFAQAESFQDLFSNGTSFKNIKSNKAEVNHKDGYGLWSGDVRATTTDNMTMTCERLEVYYEYVAETKDVIINRVIATGDVIIDQIEEGISATAERVEYNKADEKAIFTGNPVLKQGDSVMNASMIMYDVKGEKFSFENFEAVLVPDEE